MNIKVILAGALFLASTMGYTQGIIFSEGSWEEVLTRARLEKKPIFIDAYTVWCGPCKKMSAEVFTQAAVGEYFNKTFISLKMDMEKGEGIAFARKYDVSAYPTLLYFDADGELMNKSVGYKDAAVLMKASLEALDPKNQIGSFKKEYEASDQSLKSLIAYCAKLRKADNFKLAREVAVERLEKLTKKERYSKDAWSLTTGYVRDYTSPLFKNVLVNKKRYKQVAGSVEINKYIHSVLGNTSLFYRSRTDSGVALSTYLALLKDLRKYVNSDYYIARANYFSHLDSPDDQVFKYASAFLDQDYVLDYDDGKMGYYLAFMANRYVDEEGDRQEAAYRWATKAALLDDRDYKSKFLLSRLLYRQGKYGEALPLAEQASILEKETVEAGVIKQLFKADSIGAFVEQIKGHL